MIYIISISYVATTKIGLSPNRAEHFEKWINNIIKQRIVFNSCRMSYSRLQQNTTNILFVSMNIFKYYSAHIRLYRTHNVINGMTTK